ncbi:MAG: DUF5069 domain-containing protein [Verrucomicrobiota bacterium]
MSDFHWDQRFKDLFERSLERYRGGDEEVENYFTDDDLAFLKSIGYKPREFFDFVEDYADHGVPTPEAAVLVAAARRDYLDVEQGGEHSGHEVKPEELPERDAELGGHEWLPRIIVKARAKLRGELDPDIMYSCGGDRAFLGEHDFHPADFLRAVWAAGDDDEKVLEWVDRRTKKK